MHQFNTYYSDEISHVCLYDVSTMLYKYKNSLKTIYCRAELLERQMFSNEPCFDMYSDLLVS